MDAVGVGGGEDAAQDWLDLAGEGGFFASADPFRGPGDLLPCDVADGERGVSLWTDREGGLSADDVADVGVFRGGGFDLRGDG